jgi:hypothetical protein
MIKLWYNNTGYKKRAIAERRDMHKIKFCSLHKMWRLEVHLESRLLVFLDGRKEVLIDKVKDYIK